MVTIGYFFELRWCFPGLYRLPIFVVVVRTDILPITCVSWHQKLSLMLLLLCIRVDVTGSWLMLEIRLYSEAADGGSRTIKVIFQFMFMFAIMGHILLPNFRGIRWMEPFSVLLLVPPASVSVTLAGLISWVFWNIWGWSVIYELASHIKPPLVLYWHYWGCNYTGCCTK